MKSQDEEYNISIVNDNSFINKGYVYVPYVLKSTKSSINDETVWYANRWKNFLLKIKHFIIKPKYLKNEYYLKKKINPLYFGNIFLIPTLPTENNSNIDSNQSKTIVLLCKKCHKHEQMMDELCNYCYYNEHKQN